MVSPAQAEVRTPAAPTPCVHCAYDLRGLNSDSSCPECGKPVADSLRGQLLQFASREYIRTIRRGHSYVLNGILLLIVLTVVMMAMTIASRAAAPPAGTASSWSSSTLSGIDFLAEVGMTAVSFLIMFGYWLATEPDPGFTGLEKPDASRIVVRWAVAIQAATQLLSLLLKVAGPRILTSPILTGLSIAVYFVSMLAWVVQYFAMMRFERWLAGRIPDHFIIRRTVRYMWLLPVLQTVGLLLVGLGPLIALVLYWNLLDRMRKHLKSIEKHARPADLPKMSLA